MTFIHGSAALQFEFYDAVRARKSISEELEFLGTRKTAAPYRRPRDWNAG
jgi:hypothetical protein